MTVICPNDLPDAPEWRSEPRLWDAAGCCPAECEACELPAGVVLSDN